MCVAGVFATVAYVRRSVIGRTHVWATIMISFILELVAVLAIHLPKEHFPGIILLPIAVINVALVFALLRAIEITTIE